MTPSPIAVHATGLVLGEAGVLIRGPSGAGKSRLATMLLDEAPRRGCFARLVGDDRILLQAHGGRLIAAPHPAIAGLLEYRTLGLLPRPHLVRCVIRLVVDLHKAEAPLPRYPDHSPATVALAEAGSLPLLRLQGPPDALSCAIVFDTLARPLKALDGS